MRTLEGSNRVRNGLMGIIILVLVIGVGQSFASVPMLFATPTYYAQFADTGGLNPGDKVRIAGVDVGSVRSMEIEGDKVVIGYSLGGTQHRHREPRRDPHRHDPGPQEPRDRAARFRAVARQRDSAAGADHHAVPDLRRVLRRDQGGVGLGHPDGEAVAERAVGNHRPDLSASERRARRCGAVLGHDRQARRADQAAAGQRQQDRRRARQPQRADQPAAGQRADAAGGGQRARPGGQHAAGAVSGVLGAGEGLHRRQPEPQPRAGAAARPSATSWSSASTTWSTRSPRWASSPRHWPRRSRPARTSRSCWSTCCRTRSCSRSSTPRSRSAASIRRSSGGNAGLPAWRFPDPNGAALRRTAHRRRRPTVLEGTPEHPGPRCSPGSPCSYTPPADGLPRPGDPLPCAHLTTGPFGAEPVRRQLRAAECGDVAAEPARPAASRRVSRAAAIPGQLPPDMPGVPAPLAPGPPGARTVPLGPLPRAAGLHAGHRAACRRP